MALILYLASTLTSPCQLQHDPYPNTMPTLHWLTRETALKLSGQAPYRLLESLDDLSYGDPTTGNMLIQGDKLDA